MNAGESRGRTAGARTSREDRALNPSPQRIDGGGEVRQRDPCPRKTIEGEEEEEESECARKRRRQSRPRELGSTIRNDTLRGRAARRAARHSPSGGSGDSLGSKRLLFLILGGAAVARRPLPAEALLHVPHLSRLSRCRLSSQPEARPEQRCSIVPSLRSSRKACSYPARLFGRAACQASPRGGKAQRR